VPSKTHCVTSPDAVTMLLVPAFKLVPLTSYVTACLDITVNIWPIVASSNVVMVTEPPVFQRLPVATEGVVSEAANSPTAPAVFIAKGDCISTDPVVWMILDMLIFISHKKREEKIPPFKVVLLE